MSRLGDMGAKLYSGEVSYDFISRRKIWYALSGVLLAISIFSLISPGLTLGIEFRGGAEFRVGAAEANVDSVRASVAEVHEGQTNVQKVGEEVRVQTQTLSNAELREIRDHLAKDFGVTTDDISTSSVGPSWGQDISDKAIQALVVFLLIVIAFLSFYFEWRMAVGAMVALVHDLIITAGIYALVGFEVTPATVVGFLTILGYSLYDTVVVFDKVRENTRGIAGGSRTTFSGAANLAVNQTVVRSINTTVVGLLPIGSILIVGITQLGSGPLKDLALALFVGTATGAYSSIFIATPILCTLKERDPAMQALARRVEARKGGGEPAPSRAAKAGRATGTAATSADPYGEGVETESEPAVAAAGARPARQSAKPGAQRNQPKRPTKQRPKRKR